MYRAFEHGPAGRCKLELAAFALPLLVRLQHPVVIAATFGADRPAVGLRPDQRREAGAGILFGQPEDFAQVERASLG